MAAVVVGADTMASLLRKRGDRIARVDAAVAAAFDNSAREMQQVERLGGQAAVLTLEFHRWMASLWHGTRLAATLATLAAIAALLCFHIADLMIDEDDR